MMNSPALIDENKCVESCLQVAHDPAKVILIYQVLNSDEIFMELYDKYYNKIRQYVSNRYKYQGVYGEDIAQDIFMKLWERRDKIQTLASPERYLFKIEKNRFFDQRRLQILKKKAISDLEFSVVTHANTTEEDVLYHETARILQFAIQNLPERMKHTFILRQNGFKIKEIASRMGITERTATNHMQSAGKKI